jgi:hypothetical protein
MATSKKQQAAIAMSMKAAGKKPKMAKGGFPDLNKDGEITKADILKGRGVIKKYGGSIKSKKK